MLSETVDSTSNHGKREWYESFLVNKSELNGKGCGFDCIKCQAGFWFAKLKPGVVHILISSHTAAFTEILLFFLFLFKLIKCWATPNITKCTDSNLLTQRQKAPWTRIWAWILHRGTHSFLANSAAAPSQAFICARAFSLVFLFFQFSCSRQQPT